MKQTINYNLNKPDYNDVVDIEKINDNMDILDENLKRIDIKSDIFLTTNIGNNYSVTVPKLTILTDGYPITVKFNATSTGAITINTNNLGAKSVVDYFGKPITNVRAKLIANLRYESTTGNFQLLGKGGGGNATSSDLRKDKTATVDSGSITGTMPERGAPTIISGINSISLPEGYYLGGTIKSPDEYREEKEFDSLYTKLDRWVYTSTKLNTSTDKHGKVGMTIYGSKIYCIGGGHNIGNSNSNSGYTDVDIFDISTNTWSKGTSMPAGRYGHAVLSYDGKIYCIGGSQVAGTISMALYIYNISSNTWSTGTPIPRALKLFFGHGLYNGCIYCIGNDDWNSYGYKYTIASNTWEQIYYDSGYSYATCYKFTVTGSCTNNNILYMAGGSDSENGYEYGAIRKFNMANNTYNNTDLLPLSTVKYAASAFYNNKIYCLGDFSDRDDDGDKINERTWYIVKSDGSSVIKGPALNEELKYPSCVVYKDKLFCLDSTNTYFNIMKMI